MRVGALYGLGAKYLAKKDASVMGMIGSGGMARSHLRAFAAVRKIRKVKVYSPNTVGSLVYDLAKKAGLGRELPLEWFLQDIRD